MPKRIFWEKGMKLSDSLFKLSDEYRDELSCMAFSVISSGRFGLIPSRNPFHITVDFTKNCLEVTEICCTAVTMCGFLIDLSYNTVYNRFINTVVSLPKDGDGGDYYLLLNVRQGEWVKTVAPTCEPAYYFSLSSVNTPVPDYAIPVAHVVEEYGWRLDDVDFFPPCLFLSSDRKYKELKDRVLESVILMNSRLSGMVTSQCRTAVMMMWPVIQQVRTTLTMDVDLMTPMMLLGCIQKCVAAFCSACMLDENISFESGELYDNFISSPYDFRNVLTRIREGIELCGNISERILRFAEVVKPEPKAPAKKSWDGFNI